MDRYLDGCTSNPERLELGEMLRDLILARAPKRGILSVLLPCLFLPGGVNFFDALAELESRCLNDPIIWLRSPLTRHNRPGQNPYKIAVVNEWSEIRASDFRLFRRATKSPAILQECLVKELGIPLKLTFKQVAESLEATLPLRFPMALVRIYNFIDDAAQPTHVDLTPNARFEAPPKVVHKTKERYPISLRLIRSLVCRRRSGGKLPLWKASETDLVFTNDADRTVYQLCEKYISEMPPPKTKRRKLLSEERYLYAFQFAYESLVSDRRLSYVGAIEAQALRIVARLLNIQRSISHLTRQDPPRVRYLPLLSPLVIEKIYGLDKPYPSFQDVTACALRVVAFILFHAGRRARCLMNVRLSHFVFTPKACDLIVPDTKVGRLSNQPIPLTALLPQNDLAFLLSWLQHLRETGTSEDTFLFDLMGIHRDDSMETDVAWGRMASKLSHALGDGNGTISTHLPRHYFLTWLPIRRLLIHNPWLLDHPLLKDCVAHDWFKPENLEKLKRLYPSPVTSLMSVLPKIVGHSHATESRRSYTRGWLIEVALLAAILRQDAGC